MLKKLSASLVAVVAVLAAIMALRFMLPRWDTQNVMAILSMDVFGSYLYLPAVFIHGDLFLSDFSWVQQIIDTYHPVFVFEQASMLANENWVMTQSPGVAVAMLPFFFIGHLFAVLLGVPADGFSVPYQLSVAMGGLLYTLLGLLMLRNILLRFFSETIAAITIILVGLGTNYFALTGIDGALRFNIEFSFVATVFWSVIKWHENNKLHNSIIAAFLSGILILMNPLNAVFLLLPILWGIAPAEFLGMKIISIKRRPVHLLIFFLILFLVAAIQSVYWRVATGDYFYINHGTGGYDFNDPFFNEVIFGFRKGWLLYTPIMAFAIIGFIQLWRKNKVLFVPVLAIFLVFSYVLCSWNEWWQGRSFGNYNFIPLYVLLAIPLAAFIRGVVERGRKHLLLATGIIGLAFVAFNVFQTWQYVHYVINPSRMTKDYYLGVLGKLSISAEEAKLLDVDHNLVGRDVFNAKKGYSRTFVAGFDFEPTVDGVEYHPQVAAQKNRFNELLEKNEITNRHFCSGKYSGIIHASQEKLEGFTIRYSDLTDKDHLWIRCGIKVLPEADPDIRPFSLVCTFEHKGKPYKTTIVDSRTAELRQEQWNNLEIFTISPILKSMDDVISVTFFNESGTQLYVDDFFIEAFQSHKEGSAIADVPSFVTDDILDAFTPQDSMIQGDTLKIYSLYFADYEKREMFENPEGISDYCAWSGTHSFKLDSLVQRTPGFENLFREIDQMNSMEIKISAMVYPVTGFDNKQAAIVASFSRGRQFFGREDLIIDSTLSLPVGEWSKVEHVLNIPKTRRRDYLKVYFWNRNKGIFYIDDFKIDLVSEIKERN